MLLIFTANMCLFKFRVIKDTCVCIDISSIIRNLLFTYRRTLILFYSTNVRVQRLHPAAYPNYVISRVSNLISLIVWLVAKTHYNR